MPLLVDNPPKEVGTDRVSNCLAAHHEYGGPCIVVAFGTATVVDAVSAKGEFLGGAIAPPGVNLAVEALSEHTVTVRKVELMPPRSVLGKNTVEALQSGILYASPARSTPSSTASATPCLASTATTSPWSRPVTSLR